MVQTDNYQSISVAVEYNQTGENSVAVTNSAYTTALIIDYTKLRTTTIQTSVSGSANTIRIYATTKRGSSDTITDDNWSLITTISVANNVVGLYKLTGDYTKVIVQGTITGSGSRTLNAYYKGKN